MVQCATDYATAASSLDSLLLYLINVTNEIEGSPTASKSRTPSMKSCLKYEILAMFLS